MIILRQKEYSKIKMTNPATEEELKNLKNLKDAYEKKYPVAFDRPAEGRDSKEYKAFRDSHRKLQEKYPEYYGTQVMFSTTQPTVTVRPMDVMLDKMKEDQEFNKNFKGKLDSVGKDIRRLEIKLNADKRHRSRTTGDVLKTKTKVALKKLRLK